MLELKDWLPLLVGFIGFIGGVLVASLNHHFSRRTRLLDAYVELAGAATGLRQLAIDWAFADANTDEAWLRYGTARARLVLQERDPHRLKEIEDLTAALDSLYSVELYPDDPGEDEARVRRARTLTHNMELTRGRIDLLLASAREHLGRW